jgi:hypothetical protein
VNPRRFVAVLSIAGVVAAFAVDLFVAGAPAGASAIAMQSAEPAEPTVTPLPPPIVPPPDAAGISATTPPLGVVSPVPEPTVPDVLWLAAGDSTTVTIQMHGGRPFVPVVVDGARRDFLLSTLEPSTIDDSVAIGGDANATAVDTLQIGDIRLTGVHVSRARVAPFSLTYLGHEADGIIGSELFARYPVTVDYLADTMTVYRSQDAALAARPADGMVMALEVVAGSPAVDCAINGIGASPCLVDVDSDADLLLDWNSAQAQKRLRLGPTLSCMREAVPGREMFGQIARAKTLTLGSLTIDGPLVRFPSADSDESQDPLGWRTHLGSGALGRFAATIDESGGVLVLSGESTDLGATPFDRSGLWLISHDGGLVVRNVVGGSPGAQAGIAAGDAIVSIDGKPALDLDAVRDMLTGAPGSQVSVTFVHAQRTSNAVLTLRNLL